MLITQRSRLSFLLLLLSFVSLLLLLPDPGEARWINTKTGQVYLRPQRLNVGPKSYPASIFQDQKTLKLLGIEPYRELPETDPGPYYRKTNPKDEYAPDGVTFLRRYKLEPAMSLNDLRSRAHKQLVESGSRALAESRDDVIESLELNTPLDPEIRKRRAEIREWYQAQKKLIQQSDYDTLVKLMPFIPPAPKENGNGREAPR